MFFPSYLCGSDNDALLGACVTSVTQNTIARPICPHISSIKIPDFQNFAARHGLPERVPFLCHKLKKVRLRICGRTGKSAEPAARQLRIWSMSWFASLTVRYHWPSTLTGLNMKPIELGVGSPASFSKNSMLYFTSFSPSVVNV